MKDRDGLRRACEHRVKKSPDLESGLEKVIFLIKLNRLETYNPNNIIGI